MFRRNSKEKIRIKFEKRCCNFYIGTHLLWLMTHGPETLSNTNFTIKINFKHRINVLRIYFIYQANNVILFQNDGNQPAT